MMNEYMDGGLTGTVVAVERVAFEVCLRPTFS